MYIVWEDVMDGPFQHQVKTWDEADAKVEELCRRYGWDKLKLHFKNWKSGKTDSIVKPFSKPNAYDNISIYVTSGYLNKPL